MSLMPQPVIDAPAEHVAAGAWEGLLRSDAKATTAETAGRLPHPRPDVEEHLIEEPLAPIIGPSAVVEPQLSIRDRLPAVRTGLVDLLQGVNLIDWLSDPSELPGDAPLMDLTRIAPDQRLFPLGDDPDGDPYIVCDVVTAAQHDLSCPGGEALHTDADGRDGAPTWLCGTCHEAVLL